MKETENAQTKSLVATLEKSSIGINPSESPSMAKMLPLRPISQLPIRIRSQFWSLDSRF